jgi:phage FluMu protein Com
MINTDSYSDRCVVCGKFLKRVDHYGKLCPKHYEILNLIDKANNAIFHAESALYKLEKAHSCKPLYRMRINLGYVKQAYKNGAKVCEMTTP